MVVGFYNVQLHNNDSYRQNRESNIIDETDPLKPTLGERVAKVSMDLAKTPAPGKCGLRVREAYKKCGITYGNLALGHRYARYLDDDVFKSDPSWVLVADYDPKRGDHTFEIKNVRQGAIAVFEGGPKGHVEIIQKTFNNPEEAAEFGTKISQDEGYGVLAYELPKQGWFSATSTSEKMSKPGGGYFGNNRVTVWRHKQDIEDEKERELLLELTKIKKERESDPILGKMDVLPTIKIGGVKSIG